MAQAAKSNVSELNNDVSKQVQILREDVAKLTETMAEYGKARGLAMKEDAVAKASNVAASGKDAAKVAQHKAQDAYAGAEDAVRHNPAAAVGIAAGIGFLVGMIATRR